MATTAAAAQDIRIERLVFEPGATETTVRDAITGYQSVSYTVGAEAGQTMRVALDPSNLATYFNVYAPGRGPGDEALANSGLTGPPTVPEINRFDAELTMSGEYTISVYMMRSAARREERSDYTLEIAVEGDHGPVVQGDFADGLQGGPDYWEVRTSGGPLNVRATASSGATVLGTFAAGTVLRNLGCRMAEGRRWCEVATADDTMTGWVAGDFLVESAMPSRATNREPITRTERVAFAAGTSGAVVDGELGRGEAVNYVLGASEGQVLSVRLSAADPAVHFNIVAPGGDILHDTTSGSGREYRGQLPLSGDHMVQVYYLGDAPAAAFEVEFVIE